MPGPNVGFVDSGVFATPSRVSRSAIALKYLRRRWTKAFGQIPRFLQKPLIDKWLL